MAVELCPAVAAQFGRLCADDNAAKRGSKAGRVYRALAGPLLRPLIGAAMDRTVATNVSMLMFRSANAAWGFPNTNKDWVAPLFFQHLRPEDASNIAVAGAPTAYARLRRTLFELPFVGVPGMINYLDARTQFFDERVAAALDAGCKQVVVVAAGFDSTAYRHHRAGVKFFEIDLPHASAAKRALIDATLPDAARYPRPAYVAADLSVTSLADALAGTGFDASQPTFFLVQGLVMYLAPAAVAGLLGSVRALSAPGSALALDFLRLEALTGASPSPGLEAMRAAVALRGEPFLSGIGGAREAADELAALFGYEVSDHASARQLAERHLPHLKWSEWPCTVMTAFTCAEFAVARE
jgi:methyltransferase (TIGR00027 family)